MGLWVYVVTTSAPLKDQGEQINIETVEAYCSEAPSVTVLM